MKTEEGETEISIVDKKGHRDGQRGEGEEKREGEERRASETLNHRSQFIFTLT